MKKSLFNIFLISQEISIVYFWINTQYSDHIATSHFLARIATQPFFNLHILINYDLQVLLYLNIACNKSKQSGR